MSRLFQRKEGQASYQASTQSRIELSRNYHMQGLLLKLEVNHDNATAVFNDEDLFALINNIEIVANGNENIKQIPASKLWLDNVVSTGMDGLRDIKTANGTGLTSYVYAMVNFSCPNTVRPHDTILNTGVFSTFDLLINWGSDTTIGSGITVNSAKISVSSSSLVGYKRNAGETIKYFKETSLVEEITSTTNEHTIQLPVNKLYKSISIVATVNGIKNDNVIKGIRVKSGTTNFVDLDFESIRALNNFDFRPENTDGLKGIAVIDFASRGRLSDMLNTVSNFNTLEVVLDVEKQTGTNKVYVLTDSIEDTNIVEK